MKQSNYSWSQRVFIHDLLLPLTLRVTLNSKNNLCIDVLDYSYYLSNYIYLVTDAFLK